MSFLLCNPDKIIVSKPPDPALTAYKFMQGKTWRTCENCEGDGWFYNYEYRPDETSIIDGKSVRGSFCLVCSGTGGFFASWA